METRATIPREYRSRSLCCLWDTNCIWMDTIKCYVDGVGHVVITPPLRKKILGSDTEYSSGRVSTWTTSITGRRVQRFIPIQMCRQLELMKEEQEA